MGSGELTERVTIQMPSKVADGMGGFTETWNDGDTIWAEAWTVSSVERINDMKPNMIRIQKFKIYYRRIFLPSWRLKWGNRYFNITGIDPDKRRVYIYLTVEESI